MGADGGGRGLVGNALAGGPAGVVSASRLTTCKVDELLPPSL